jgi:tRNA-splicing ligase RtcB (3'-phosphate/5'-hydroxy nucleic acid ligase)
MRDTYVTRAEPAPWRQWGDNLEASAVEQMVNACRLPISLRGALMPDAHVGYGLPIGGVLATQNAVIPYAVGVDIACRVKLSIYDLPPATIESDAVRLKASIENETRFGVGASFKNRRDHDVMDEDWSVTGMTRQNKDKAWAQLGTSGSGNHFVEFGVFRIDHDELAIPPGEYLALLSHSGSRGTGAQVAGHYSKLARALHPELPKELAHLAWLDLDSEEGREYWAAMELMGKYAAANHALIHRHIARSLGARVILDIENHHNFAWKEVHDGNELIVHRKGATPAGEGVLGVIPGSMADPAYIVTGKGKAESLRSASHGAGRRMSRSQAIKTLDWAAWKSEIKNRGVRVLSCGLDEVPGVYKDIRKVMEQQMDLVNIVARFDPKLVKMSDDGKNED